MCIENVDFNVMINGDTIDSIFPRKGMRQRDPLSPHLFIICMEGLTMLLKKAKGNGDIHGIKVC